MKRKQKTLESFFIKKKAGDGSNVAPAAEGGGPFFAPFLYLQSLLLCSDEWNGRLRAIKRQSWATAAPLLVSSCSGDLRSMLPWGITLDHLWDAKQERTSRWWRRGLRSEQERPQTQLAPRTISCPPTRPARCRPACLLSPPRPTQCPAPAT